MPRSVTDLELMFDTLEKGDPVFLPSEFWRQLNEKNIQQLNESGIENLKRSVAQNYFTWVVPGHDDQYQALRKLAPWTALAAIRAPYSSPAAGLSDELARALVKFTRMLWLFAERNDREKLLKTLQEPEFGNPFDIRIKGRLISQDLANSLLEYYAIREKFTTPRESSPTILACIMHEGFETEGWRRLRGNPVAKDVGRVE